MLWSWCWILTNGPRCDKTCLRGFLQSDTQASLFSYRDKLENGISLVATLNMLLYNIKQRTKALIRLICAGLSAPLMFASPQRQVFSHTCPNKTVIFSLFFLLQNLYLNLTRHTLSRMTMLNTFLFHPWSMADAGIMSVGCSIIFGGGITFLVWRDASFSIKVYRRVKHYKIQVIEFRDHLQNFDWVMTLYLLRFCQTTHLILRILVSNKI